MAGNMTDIAYGMQEYWNAQSDRFLQEKREADKKKSNLHSALKALDRSINKLSAAGEDVTALNERRQALQAAYNSAQVEARDAAERYDSVTRQAWNGDKDRQESQGTADKDRQESQGTADKDRQESQGTADKDAAAVWSKNAELSADPKSYTAASQNGYNEAMADKNAEELSARSAADEAADAEKAEKQEKAEKALNTAGSVIGDVTGAALSSSLNAYIGKKLADAQVPGADHLNRQAENNMLRSAEEQGYEQRANRIASRNFRTEADKTAMAKSRAESDQRVANLQDATGAAAGLARVEEAPDTDTTMRRSDEQSKLANEYNKDKWDFQQYAEQERAAVDQGNAEALNNNWYNGMAEALAAGGAEDGGRNRYAESEAESADSAGTVRPEDKFNNQWSAKDVQDAINFTKLDRSTALALANDETRLKGGTFSEERIQPLVALIKDPSEYAKAESWLKDWRREHGGSENLGTAAATEAYGGDDGGSVYTGTTTTSGARVKNIVGALREYPYF